MKLEEIAHGTTFLLINLTDRQAKCKISAAFRSAKVWKIEQFAEVMHFINVHGGALM